jgi:hypothetical protein
LGDRRSRTHFGSSTYSTGNGVCARRPCTLR